MRQVNSASLGGAEKRGWREIRSPEKFTRFAIREYPTRISVYERNNCYARNNGPVVKFTRKISILFFNSESSENCMYFKMIFHPPDPIITERLL